MPRILLLTTDLEIGGTPAVVRELAVRLHALRRAGDEIKVACLGRFGPVAAQIRDRGVEVEALDARGATDVAVIGRLGALMRRWRIDTVLSFLVHANAAAAIVSLMRGNIRCLQSIQTTQPWPRWHWRVQRLASLAAERIIVPSESVATAACDWSALPREKVLVIPNAVEVERFEPLIGKARRPTAVGFIGRLDPVKRVPDLLDALARLGSEVTLEIYGDGAERSAIRGEIDRLGIGDRVTMHGAVHDVRHALEQMGVLVLPSEAEGFGLVLIEAMAAGVPVVATDVPGIRDVVKHEVNGLLVPAGNPAALASAIDRVIKDRELRKHLTEGGQVAVRDRYNWETVIRQYAQLLRIMK